MLILVSNRPDPGQSVHCSTVAQPARTTGCERRSRQTDGAGNGDGGGVWDNADGSARRFLVHDADPGAAAAPTRP